MITVGVDLAAEAKRTAVAVVEWSGRDARVRRALVNADDETVLEAIGFADKSGIDCPLGWPDDFIEFVNAHHNLERVPTSVGLEARRPLRYRATDQWLVDESLGRPLSVSSDLIGVCAMRAAGLLSALSQAGLEIDRSGVSGRVAETYPAAAIRQWKLGSDSYKGASKVPALDPMVDKLRHDLPQLSFEPDTEDSCRASDHAFDALICALVARATTQYRCTFAIPPGLASRAQREGWIHVPNCRLFELLAPPEFT